jgi:hypothetical protein
MFHTSARRKACSFAVAVALATAGGSALPRLTTRLPRAHAEVTSVTGAHRHPTVPPHSAAHRAMTARPRFTGRLRVAYFGDSLAHEAQEHFAARLLATRRTEVHVATFGGTAICDWFERMRTEAATWRPNVAVVEFSGNALTPCMQDAQGNGLTGAAYVDKYRADADEVLRIFSSVGAEVYFAGAPISRRDAEDPDYHGGAINAVYRAIARSDPAQARFVDAGASVLDHGHWTATLPCAAGEPCGPDGRNVVRAPDGAHFCPTAGEARRGVTGACAVWSSGAYRYGLAMAAPVVHDFSL